MLKRGTKKTEPELEEKILNVDASMQGTLSFKDPVNLCINGNFDGNLDTKGRLTIGRTAVVHADIKGEYVLIGGRVAGEVIASRELKIAATAQLTGNIKTPSLSVEQGAVFQGKCEMFPATEGAFLTVDEVARYLEVDAATVCDWAKKGEIPASPDGDGWKFDKAKIEQWVAAENK